MEFVNEYVRNVVIFTLFVNIGGVLINEGDSRRIYKFVCGLILMIIVVNSFLKLLDINVDDFFKAEFSAKELNELENKINSNNEYLRENSLTTYEIIVKDNVERIVEIENYILDEMEMHCDTNNHITHLDLWISKKMLGTVKTKESTKNDEENEKTRLLESKNDITEIRNIEEIKINVDNESKKENIDSSVNENQDASKYIDAEKNIIIGNIRRNVFILYGIDYENINVYINEVDDEGL